MGHLSVGYISGKASAKLLKTEINVPLVLTLSIIADVDILFPVTLQHRGPTHSVILALIIFIPFFVVYRKNAVPYFIALIQHSLVGDYIVGGDVQLLWPVTSQYYGASISMTSLTNVILEWVTFLASTIIMLKTGDLAALFKPHNSNLILAAPAFAVLFPTVASLPLGVATLSNVVSYPLFMPTWLIAPHLVYLCIFLASIFIDVFEVAR